MMTLCPSHTCRANVTLCLGSRSESWFVLAMHCSLHSLPPYRLMQYQLLKGVCSQGRLQALQQLRCETHYDQCEVIARLWVYTGSIWVLQDMRLKRSFCRHSRACSTIGLMGRSLLHWLQSTKSSWPRLRTDTGHSMNWESLFLSKVIVNGVLFVTPGVCDSLWGIMDRWVRGDQPLDRLVELHGPLSKCT